MSESKQPDGRGRRRAGGPRLGVLGRLQAAVTALAVLGSVLLVGVVGLHAMRASAAQQIYKERLGELGEDYASLIDRYNLAVRQSAVTELVVERDEGGVMTLAVEVRDRLGRRDRIETPFDPTGEVYVDFVILNGRVWIRRVFDADTPPSAGVVVDPAVADVQWSADGSGYGKAVYRELSEGRWAVSVSGSGSLSLAPVAEGEAVDLVSPPELTPMSEIEAEAREQANAITWGDLLERLLNGG